MNSDMVWKVVGCALLEDRVFYSQARALEVFRQEMFNKSKGLSVDEVNNDIDDYFAAGIVSVEPVHIE